MAKSYRQAILLALKLRGPGKTICPSEVLVPEQKKNKKLMANVRASAQKLIEEGLILATSSGKRIDISTHRGPIRLKLRS